MTVRIWNIHDSYRKTGFAIYHEENFLPSRIELFAKKLPLRKRLCRRLVFFSVIFLIFADIWQRPGGVGFPTGHFATLSTDGGALADLICAQSCKVSFWEPHRGAAKFPQKSKKSHKCVSRRWLILATTSIVWSIKIRFVDVSNRQSFINWNPNQFFCLLNKLRPWVLVLIAINRGKRK